MFIVSSLILCICTLQLLVVKRHQARVIDLEYVGAGEIDQTLLLVGKVSKMLFFPNFELTILF